MKLTSKIGLLFIGRFLVVGVVYASCLSSFFKLIGNYYPAHVLQILLYFYGIVYLARWSWNSTVLEEELES